MQVVHSKNRRPSSTNAALLRLLQTVSIRLLKQFVEQIAYPRHYIADRAANLRARDQLVNQLQGFGYTPKLQGRYDNIIATAKRTEAQPLIVLGAHYDSVPGTPGADDNASAVAVCMECARLIQEHQICNVQIVLFNREEDGLLGSTDYVAELDCIVQEAHIFEMVGFRSFAPGSQRMPPGLPGVMAPDVGDFLALLSNRKSNTIAEQILSLASSYQIDPPVLALKVFLGLERHFPHLLRSDHAPFWQAGIPAVMWSDTSEFRNPNYHQRTDTPDTLDYEFMGEITKLALARIVTAD
jgi:Zn-dependent M28 family amino/carboxypeptidase